MAVRVKLGVGIIKKSVEVFFSAWDINRLGDVGQNLAYGLDVAVGWRACDGGEIGHGIGK